MIRLLFPTVGDVVALLAWLAVAGLYAYASRRKRRPGEWSGIDRHNAARRALAASRCTRTNGGR